MLTKTPTATFIRHYIEMVVVMFAGMIVLGLPGEAALKAIGSGTSELRDDAPAVVFLGMAATMTIPMVAWMRYRGHRWQPTLEMAASMIIPTLVAIALLAAGVLELRRAHGPRARRDAARHARRDAAAGRRVHQPRPPRRRGLTRRPATRRTGAPPMAGLLASGSRRPCGWLAARRSASRRGRSLRRCTRRRP